jgi:MFS family permease
MSEPERSEKHTPSRKSLRTLDTLHVFLADVRDGVEPYLSVDLKSSQNWNPAQIVLVLSALTIATVLAQTPAGALVDNLRQKRLLLVIAAIAVSIGCIQIVMLSTLPVVVICQVLIGLAAAVFPPAIAAITLGLMGHKWLDRRIGRNEMFNYMCNLVAATLAGLIGQFVTAKGIFFLVAAMAISSSLSALRIREREYEHELVRGAADDEESSDPQFFCWRLLCCPFEAFAIRSTITPTSWYQSKS